MKTITATKTVPAEDVTVTTYGCDGCDYTSDNEKRVEVHYAKKHACRKTAEINDAKLRWFNTEADAKAWLAHEGQYDFHKVDWSEPGWYASETWQEPCRRGCCTESYMRLYPVASLIDESIVEARSIMHKVMELRKFLKENGVNSVG